MVKMYCPKCGPIRTTFVRLYNELDLDNIPHGPVLGSRCSVCGSHLHIGYPSKSKQSRCMGIVFVLLMAIIVDLVGVFMLG